MRTDVVKQPRTLAIITFTAMMALIYARLFYAPYPTESILEADMPLGRAIDRLFGMQLLLPYMAGLMLVFINGALVAHLIDKYNISTVRTYLPIVTYLVVGYGIVAPIGTVSAGLVSTMLILSTEQSIASFKRSYTFGNVFNSAFCLGIMPLIYSASLPLIIIMPIGLSLYRRTAREWIVAMAGLGVPLLLASAGYYIAGYGWRYVAGSLVESFAPPLAQGVIGTLHEMGIMTYICSGLIVAFLMFSLWVIMVNSHKMGVRTRKIYTHFICLTLFCITTFFIPSGSIVSVGLLAVPASGISTAFFIRFRGWLGLIAYLVLIVSIIIVNAVPLIEMGMIPF